MREAINAQFDAFRLTDDTDIDKQVEALFKHLGLRLRARTLFSTHMWNGETFNRNLPGRHLLHDLAHWLLAPMRRKNLPEFGLGPGPESLQDGTIERNVSAIEASEEESEAALLGILIQHHLGIPVGFMFDEIYSTSFGEKFNRFGNEPGDTPNIIAPWNRLVDKGMIDTTGYPRVLLDYKR